jgi:hypothetical protein
VPRVLNCRASSGYSRSVLAATVCDGFLLRWDTKLGTEESSTTRRSTIVGPGIGPSPSAHTHCGNFPLMASVRYRIVPAIAALWAVRFFRAGAFAAQLAGSVPLTLPFGHPRRFGRFWMLETPPPMSGWIVSIGTVSARPGNGLRANCSSGCASKSRR